MPIYLLDQFCRQLHHRCVRDLAFSLYSESLLRHMHDCNATPYALTFDASAKRWLRQLDSQPAPLMAHLAKRTSTRLGLYFESLWCFYWQYIDQSRLLLHNHQLSRNGKTLGAMDFVIETKDGQLVHIEAAAKFFLGIPKDAIDTKAASASHSVWHSETLDWIGPNANDRLAWKLDHMRRHQLPLSSQPESRQAIARACGKEAPVRTQFLLRGCLFWPASDNLIGPASTTKPGLNEDINPNANRGHWWRLADFLQMDRLTDCEYFTVLPRNHWLAPACYPSALVPLSFTTIKQALTKQMAWRPQGIMVVGLRHSENQWYEVRRFFVVADQWPETARPSRNT
ncbi:DUF1853 family protein [Gilvimarinus polysaccharolyticus]|uniref:DUF1853 family protein n=1 Tax=Gilvimarinus polysaccharolyticus TaxID=863921 RepID=UPI0006732610|nr:DUF1853 family protein [Gilvimarinus polysaccharolyticus]